MKPIAVYQKFVEERGQSLADMNPGSTQFALTVCDALCAVDILDVDGSTISISGGDIMTENVDGSLMYALHSWGYEYCYLDWYVSDKTDDESEEDYAKRSRIVARDAINAANEVAMRLGKKCYVAFVIPQRFFADGD